MFSPKDSCGLKGKESLSWDELGRSPSLSSLTVSETVVGVLSLAHRGARDAPALVVVMDNATSEACSPLPSRGRLPPCWPRFPLRSLSPFM